VRDPLLCDGRPQLQRRAGCVLGAQMPLTLASEQTEVRLTVAIDATAIPRLAALCLGDAAAPEESVRDVLREFANTAGGAFVRAASQEGVSLTHGLPVDVKAEAFSLRRTGARQQFVLATRDGVIRINFDLEILSKALRRVNVGPCQKRLRRRGCREETRLCARPARAREAASTELFAVDDDEVRVLARRDRGAGPRRWACRRSYSVSWWAR